MAEGKLTDEVKTYIVQALACFDAPTVVAKAVKDEFDSQTRTRGAWVVSWREKADAEAEVFFAAYLARAKEREAQRLARLRVICGATTRKGEECRNKSEPGKRRCKFHGGKSTEAKTPEGIARIAEAQRRRWARAKASAFFDGGK